MLGAIALASAPSACGATSPPACSEGPARTRLDQAQPTTGSVVGCQPRCEVAHLPGGTWPLAAVPSGACDRDEYVCGMQVSVGCTTHGVECTCLDDEWQCAIVWPGAGICVDAGPPVPLGPPACSDGPARTSLGTREAKPYDGVCIPRCGQPLRANGIHPIEAVPSGACAPDRNEYACRMTVSDGCVANDVQCECRNEIWECGIVRAGSCDDAGDARDAAD